MSAAHRPYGPPKAIIFDLDGTLWDTAPALVRAEQAVYEWLDRHYPRLPQAFSLDELRELRRTLALRYPYLRHDVTELRKASLSIAASHLGLDPRLAEDAFQVFMTQRNRVRVYEDVRPTLQRLGARYTLCSLTNGNADLVAIGLHELFHHSLSAAEVRAAKPAREAFLKVCALAGVSPEQAVHVGDEAETDMAGAAAAGCRTVWMNRGGGAWSYAWRPDAEIASLSELEALLTGWERSAE